MQPLNKRILIRLGKKVDAVKALTKAFEDLAIKNLK